MNIVRITLFAAAGVMVGQALLIKQQRKEIKKNQLAAEIAIETSREIKRDLDFVLGCVCEENSAKVEAYFDTQKLFYDATKSEDLLMRWFSEIHE